METTSIKKYYSVPMDTERGEAIRNFVAKAKECVERTKKVALQLGAVSYCESPNAVYPGIGIGSLVFNRPQSKRAYQLIGRRKKVYEYIPMYTTPRGKDIIKKILGINPIGSEEFAAAFNLPDNVKFAPSWFEESGYYYLCTRYEMGDEYTEIGMRDFEDAKERLEEQDKERENGSC